jgi:hypothetical protein
MFHFNGRPIGDEHNEAVRTGRFTYRLGVKSLTRILQISNSTVYQVLSGSVSPVTRGRPVKIDVVVKAFIEDNLQANARVSDAEMMAMVGKEMHVLVPRPSIVRVRNKLRIRYRPRLQVQALNDFKTPLVRCSSKVAGRGYIRILEVFTLGGREVGGGPARLPAARAGGERELDLAAAELAHRAPAPARHLVARGGELHVRTHEQPAGAVAEELGPGARGVAGARKTMAGALNRGEEALGLGRRPPTST